MTQQKKQPKEAQKPKPIIKATLDHNAVIRSKLSKVVSENRVVLFMKGSPDEPRCGFSKRVATILKAAGVANLVFVDVLKDENVREGVKKFSNWPTIPQLYVC